MTYATRAASIPLGSQPTLAVSPTGHASSAGRVAKALGVSSLGPVGLHGHLVSLAGPSKESGGAVTTLFSVGLSYHLGLAPPRLTL